MSVVKLNPEERVLDPLFKDLDYVVKPPEPIFEDADYEIQECLQDFEEFRGHSCMDDAGSSVYGGW